MAVYYNSNDKNFMNFSKENISTKISNFTHLEYLIYFLMISQYIVKNTVDKILFLFII